MKKPHGKNHLSAKKEEEERKKEEERGSMERKTSSINTPKDNFSHPKQISQLKEARRCKGFREDVGNLLLSRKIIQAENPILNMLSNEVHVNLNMLGSLMLNRIARNMNGTLVITEEYKRSILGKTKLS